MLSLISKPIVIFLAVILAGVGVVLKTKSRQIPKQPAPLRIAVGTDELEVSLSSDSLEKKRGEIFEAQIKLTNSAKKDKEIRVGGVDLQFDQEVLEPLGISCGESLPVTVQNKAEGDKIYLVCFLSMSRKTIKISPGGEVILGKINFQVNSEARGGDTVVSFTRSNFPEAETDVNLSSGGKGLTYLIETE